MQHGEFALGGRENGAAAVIEDNGNDVTQEHLLSLDDDLLAATREKPHSVLHGVEFPSGRKQMVVVHVC